MTVTTDALARRLADDGILVESLGGIPLAVPEDEERLGAALARARAERLRVLPVGNGSQLAVCRPDATPGSVDLALTTRRLDAVVEYVPGDGTVTAQTGTPWRVLSETVLAGGHRLAPEIPGAANATLGGALAGGLSGPDRLRYGPLRHHVLGTRILLADGSVARSGGRLVKNVTGFDLHRLHVGSRGTLGVLLEASLRLFPAPETTLVLRAALPGVRAAVERALALGDLPGVAPETVLVEGDEDPRGLRVVLAGGEPQVAFERERVLAALAGATDVREEIAHAAASTAGWPTLRLLAAPSRLAAALETQRSVLAALGSRARVVAVPGAGVAELFAEDTDGARLVRLALELEERLAPARVRVAALAAPPEVAHALAARSALQPGTPAARWMTRLAQALDPERCFASELFPFPSAAR